MSHFAERLAHRYQRNSVIRALVQLIPAGIGSATDVAITTRIDNIREKRARAFFDTLEQQDIALTPDIVENEDFLHAYFATTRAALNTHRREKIQLFGRLFANYSRGESAESADAYEETLRILDDLSYREFQVLLILKRFEDEAPEEEGLNALQKATRFWDSFVEAVVAEVGIHHEEVMGFLVRLNRTGLYETITGSYIGYLGDKGRLTANFRTFLQALDAESEDDLSD